MCIPFHTGGISYTLHMNTYNSSEPYSIACALPHALSARQDCSLANAVKRIVPAEEVRLATRAPFLRALHIPHRHPAKWVLLLSHFRGDKAELQNDGRTAPNQGAARCGGGDGRPGSPSGSSSRLSPCAVRCPLQASARADSAAAVFFCHLLCLDFEP